MNTQKLPMQETSLMKFEYYTLTLLKSHCGGGPWTTPMKKMKVHEIIMSDLPMPTYH
jgi:hypothetical protein